MILAAPWLVMLSIEKRCKEYCGSGCLAISNARAWRVHLCPLSCPKRKRKAFGGLVEHGLRVVTGAKILCACRTTGNCEACLSKLKSNAADSHHNLKYTASALRCRVGYIGKFTAVVFKLLVNRHIKHRSSYSQYII